MITKKTKVFVIFSAMFFIVSVFGTVFVWQYVQSEGSELLNQTKEIADFEVREQTYRELEKLVKSTQDKRDELSSYILTEKKTIDFLATVEQDAVEQGVNLTTNSLKVLEGTGIFDTLVISYGIDGPEERVGNMLLLLETLPYHSFVSSVSLYYSFDEGVNRAKGSVELVISLLNYDR